MSGYKRREVRRIAKEARSTLGAGDRYARERRDLNRWLQPVRVEDDPVTACAKKSLAAYMEETERGFDPGSNEDVREVFDADSPVMKALYTEYLNGLQAKTTGDLGYGEH